MSIPEAVKPYQGSTWIVVDPATGKATCPHCGIAGWHRGNQWAGCASAACGDDNGKPALIFTAEPKCKK